MFRFLALLFLLMSSAQAHAERRVALVIGEGAYLNEPQLTNPTHDAEAMAKLFHASGFEVVTRVADGTRAQIVEALRNFARESDDADVGVVFYSGHGIELGGENFLVPVDARIETERDVKYETVSLAEVRDAIDGAKKLKLILLDACRDNPFANQMQRKDEKRGARKGLAPIEGDFGVNVVIAFAAAPGQTAEDGDGANSPFTTALLKDLTSAEIRVALGGVRDDVLAATHGAQTPYQTGSIGRDPIYLGPPPAAAATSPDDAARGDFALAQKVASVAGWDEFLKKYPDGFYAALAREERTKLFAPLPPVASPKPPQGDSTPAFRDCEDCPEMVSIPAGRAVLGSPRGEPGRDDRVEMDPQEVQIVKPFAIGRFAVTFAEWDACVADGGCRRQTGDMGFGRGRRPAIFVSWNDANAYARWLSAKTGKTYRLPSEAEWEYAARGCAAAGCGHQPFWFGAIAPDKAVYDWRFSYQNSPKAFADGQQTQPVDRGPPNPFGVYNILGNVRQWTLDCWSATMPPARTDASPVYRGDCSQRVTRGGSWNEKPANLRASARSWAEIDDRGEPDIGFRVVREMD